MTSPTHKLRQRLQDAIIECSAGDVVDTETVLEALAQTLAGVLAIMPEEHVPGLLLGLVPAVAQYEAQSRDHLRKVAGGMPDPTVRGVSGHG